MINIINNIDKEEKITEYLDTLEKCLAELGETLDEKQSEVFQKFTDTLLDYAEICKIEAFDIGYETAKTSTLDNVQAAVEILKSKQI